MWKKILAWFVQDDPYWTDIVHDYDISLPKKPDRKPSDITPLTKGMYDFAIEMKDHQEYHNKHRRGYKDSVKYETTEDLCNYLNLVFGTNFSRSKLTRIWSGKVNREDLPDGITYKIPF